MNWPQATFASKIVVAGQQATVTREIDGGLETVEVPLPAVLTPTCASTSRATRRCRTS
jgi:electron transfer flavoprotein beta subunit